MKVLKLLLGISLLVLTGCATKVSGVVSESQKVAYPAMNVEETTKVGQNIAVQAYSYSTESITLFKPYKDKLEMGRYMLFGTYGKKHKKKIFTLPDSKQKDFIIIGKDGMAYHGFANGYSSVMKGKQLDRSTYIYNKKEDVFTKQKPRQIMVYNGRKGNNIYFKYIEHNQDNVETKNISFNIRKNKVINYKGLKLKIVNAEPTYITYVKISEFE